MKKIGVFGGAFNPPHNFHFSVAQEILNIDSSFEKIIFVPVGDKYKKNDLIAAEHRYNMLRLLCDKNSFFEVSRLEIDEKEQLYAYQTLDKFKEIYPEYKLYFIIGTDSLKTLDKWANLDYLLSTYDFLVYQRGNDDFYEIMNKLPTLSKYKNNIHFLNNDIWSNLSSSYIREQLKSGKTSKYLIPEEVLDYINNNNLYII